MEKDVQNTVKRQNEYRELIEDKQDQIAYHNDQIQQLEEEIKELKEEQPMVAAAGIVRQGGASGHNSAMNWINEISDEEDGREFIQSVDAPINTDLVSQVSSDVYEDELPDLRKNGFKGVIIVDARNEELLQYYSPTELHETFYSPSVTEDLVHNTDTFEIVREGFTLEDVVMGHYDDTLSQRKEAQVERFREYAKENGFTFNDIIDVIVEYLQGILDGINFHFATNNPFEDRYNHLDKDTWVQDVNYEEDYISNVYEYRVLNEPKRICLVERGTSYGPRMENISPTPGDIAESVHPESEWPYSITYDDNSHTRSSLHLSGSAGFIGKIINTFPDGDTRTPTLQLKR